MSLETQLGLGMPDGDLWVLACDRWHGWKRARPVLGVCDELPDLRTWVRRQTDPGAVNTVLLTLAELGAEDGGDDPAAAGALLWLLMPGAVRMAQSLMPLSDKVDQLVAAQLWLSARTVNWSKGIQVAGTLLMNTRRDAVEELGLSRRRRAARSREVPVDDIELIHALRPPWQPVQPGEDSTASSPGACDLLHDLLEVAATEGRVDLDDCRILLELADAAESPRASRGHAGLLGREAAAVVAAERGISRATVCRRAKSALTVLQGTYATQVRSA
ncbi:hypothetical protein MWU75_15370 [Ornithinimicrobium sp. F0845]|uniref:hypothetical protein n=1 Tax=Ornithinimicrobium sp. F0845 TaxID=2926412 RepID=UPI001FF62FE9|nr:hypothetical protein [Ornithinimicrobium sp. F0845]MCK0113527.1 hypothetical protein [Ornithinimicrobium sp. F0845]